MFYRKVFLGFIAAAIVSLPLSQASDDSIIPLQISAVGQVRFEQRFLRVVTDSSDESGEDEEQVSVPVSQQQMYWSLVILSGNSKYIYGQQYGSKPDFVELGGQVLRQGSTVKIEGQAVKVTSVLYQLLEIQSVTLVMDAVDAH